MTEVFGSSYAALYDATYAEKDYAGEVDAIVRLLRDHGVTSGAVLDLGCGTGRHAVHFSSGGFEVLGVDRSGPMLAQARGRATNAEFVESDIRAFRTETRFDAVTMMFAVLGYQLGNADLEAALSTVQVHLKPGGLFLCDFWYGPAVLMTRPEPRLRVTETQDSTMIRASSSTLDVERHTCTVSIEMWVLKSGVLESHVQEDHEMRFFFPREIEMAFDHAGLELVTLRSFPELGEVSTETWNVLAVGRAR